MKAAFLDDVPVSTATFQGERDQSRARSGSGSSLSYFILLEQHKPLEKHAALGASFQIELH